MFEDATYEELLKERILDRYDPEELMDLLKIPPLEFLDRIWDLILDNLEELEVDE